MDEIDQTDQTDWTDSSTQQRNHAIDPRGTGVFAGGRGAGGWEFMCVKLIRGSCIDDTNSETVSGGKDYGNRN